MKLHAFIISIFFLLLSSHFSFSQSYEIKKTAESSKGMVVSAHPLASKAGADVLGKGGNAFDAAVAVQLALAVVYPGAGNIGGGGFLLARTKEGKIIILDYREKAPLKAHRNIYLDKKGNVLDKLSAEGRLAVGVPGTVDGIFSTLRFTKLPFEELINPAIELAEKGFEITEREAAQLNDQRQLFLKHNSHPTAFVKKEDWKVGDILIQRDLAKTLIRIKQKGRAGFYEGKNARLLVQEMKRGNGIITKGDLKNYSTAEREAIEFKYKNFQIISLPPPSAGGIILRQIFGMMEQFPVSKWGHQDPRYVHLIAECERRAYADRAEYLGDPDFVKVPVNELTDPEYIKKRISDFNPNAASKSSEIKPGVFKESEETTHLSIVDAEGNAVSVTTTLNDTYGSSVVVKGGGYILNNEMDDFSSKPGVPNIYGLVGGEANSIEPGKRMLSSMTPTIVLKDGELHLVVGTPGGSTIPTTVFQTITNVIEFNLPLEQAVNAPRFHHQWLPDVIHAERNYPQDVLQTLEKMGHQIKLRKSMGRMDAIIVMPDGSLFGVGDIRGDDSAEGMQ
jgi:gamma-glutamyltranspeptidase / glutathione hydrolase